MTSHRSSFSQQKLIAVLGPTNTGKTHLAVERLCAHSSGLIGFPLRLLAREVYDRVCAIKGPKEVALITGEERIVPQGARWVLATMESMPIDGDYAFVAMDEAQLGADPERGHIFTQRILHARGREETMILGSASLRPMIEALLPEAEIVTRPRFSTLSFGGHKKLSRLPPRSAIVAFSAEEVYATAELLRRFRGGAAVVMGALSPRTRNAQVAMFQSGEVDYLVATDAIGMGLNLDVHHVAFAALRKFDGRRQRRLNIAEMSQIAGRAGRHQRDGSFGSLAALTGGRSMEFTPEEIERIENHQVPPLSHLYWRQHDLDYANLDALTASLNEKPSEDYLRSSPEALDMAVLQRLVGDSQIAADATSLTRVARLWAACSLPDFRQLGADHHARFVAQLWNYLKDGVIPHDYASRKLDEIDNAKGDVGTLSGRLAAIRNWAYIAERPDWLDGRSALGQRARDIEEKLSDALHSALAERFVDRRASILMRRMTQDSDLLSVTLDDNDVVAVDGEAIGRLEGFHFHVGSDAKLADRKMLLAAAERHIGALLAVRAKALVDDEDKAFSLSDTVLGGICWQGIVVARWQRSGKMLAPSMVLDRSLDGLDQQSRDAIAARLAAWVKAVEERDLKTLTALQTLSENPESTPSMRAVATQLIENGGVVARGPAMHELLGALSDEERQALRSAHVRIGALDLFIPSLNNQRTRKWLHHILAVWYKKTALPADPMAGLPAMLAVQADNDGKTDDDQAPDAHRQGQQERHLGYRRAGNSWLRVDMAEKLLRAAHDARQTSSKPAKAALPAPPKPTQSAMAENVEPAAITDALPSQTESSPAQQAEGKEGPQVQAKQGKVAQPEPKPKPKSKSKPKAVFALSDHLALSIGLTREDWEKLLRTGGFRRASPQDISAAGAGAETQPVIADAKTDTPKDAVSKATSAETTEQESLSKDTADKDIKSDASAEADAETVSAEDTVLWRWTGLNKQRRRKPVSGRKEGGHKVRSAKPHGKSGDSRGKSAHAKGRSGNRSGTGKAGANNSGGQKGRRGNAPQRAAPMNPEFEKLRALFPQKPGSGGNKGKKPKAKSDKKSDAPPMNKGDGGAAG